MFTVCRDAFIHFALHCTSSMLNVLTRLHKMSYIREMERGDENNQVNQGLLNAAIVFIV